MARTASARMYMVVLRHRITSHTPGSGAASRSAARQRRAARTPGTTCQRGPHGVK